MSSSQTLTNPNMRIRRNCPAIACMSRIVNRENPATELDRSHSNTRSGRCGERRRRAGRIGTPPVDIERRSVLRMSISPRAARRRLAAIRLASFLARGVIVERNSCTSVAPARRKGVCSAGGRTAYRLIRSGPRASALRRRDSISTRRRNSATAARNSSLVKRSAKPPPAGLPCVPLPLPPDPPLPSPRPPGTSSAASRIRSTAPAMASWGASRSSACAEDQLPVLASLGRRPSSATVRAASRSIASRSAAASATANSSRRAAARTRRSAGSVGRSRSSTPMRPPRADGNQMSKRSS